MNAYLIRIVLSSTTVVGVSSCCLSPPSLSKTSHRVGGLRGGAAMSGRGVKRLPPARVDEEEDAECLTTFIPIDVFDAVLARGSGERASDAGPHRRGRKCVRYRRIFCLQQFGSHARRPLRAGPGSR